MGARHWQQHHGVVLGPPRLQGSRVALATGHLFVSYLSGPRMA